ncbi:MAG TPA: hypothetical protein ENN42_06865 [Thioalkalivibrio sp.]|nr:hypothetical protein [Thioalkalivibrio sp.]
MTQSVNKILFLRVPEADDSFGRQIIDGLGDGVSHEFVDVTPGDYDAILDRLGPGVLPVVLKASR